MAGSTLPTDMVKRITAIERELAALRKRAPLQNSAITHGTLSISGTGRIVLIGDDGSELILDANGTTPTVQFLPAGDSTNPATITAVASGDEASMVFTSGVDEIAGTRTKISVTSTDLQLSIEPAGSSPATDGVLIDLEHPEGSTDSALVMAHVDYSHYGDGRPLDDGGYVALAPGYGIFGIDDQLSEQAFLEFLAGYGLLHYGYWAVGFTIPLTGLVLGATAPGASGDTSVAVVYGTSMATHMHPLYSLADTTVHPSTLTTWSFTGFTVSWTTAAASGYQLMYWSFRTGLGTS